MSEKSIHISVTQARAIVSDITKCTGEGCPWKQNCKRKRAPVNPLNQSWFLQVPGYYTTAAKSGGPLSDDHAEWRCDYYLPDDIGRGNDAI